MPCKKPLNEKPESKPQQKTSGKTQKDYIPTKDKSPDDMEIFPIT